MESDSLFELLLASLLTQRQKVVCYNFYSPVQSDFITATVLRYDPSNQNVQLEYVKVTISDMQDTFSKRMKEIWKGGDWKLYPIVCEYFLPFVSVILLPY